MRGLERHRALLGAGGEIVTATPGQARRLQIEFGRAAAAGAAGVWPTPAITPWAGWLAREFRAAEERPALLDDYAALRLWQQVIADSADAEGLIGVAATAAAVAHAWALAHDWQIAVDGFEPQTPEQSAFRRWAVEFRRRSHALGVIDRARLPLQVAARRGQSSPPLLGWHGFGVVTPSRAALGAALTARGCGVVELALDGAPGDLACCTAPTAAAESEALAGWLAARLGVRPAARLVVLVPDLAARAASLARLLDDRLAPSLLEPGAGDGRPYAIAVAPRLAAHAVVDAALGVLALAGEHIDLGTLGRLLRSPYLPAGDGVAARRARLDAELRRDGARTLAGAELPRRLRTGAAAEPGFAALVESVRTALAAPARRGPAEWADAMQSALRAAGWPKGRALGALEYQAARAVNESLAAFAGLGALLPPLGLDAALAELGALLAAERSPPDAGDAAVLLLDRLEDPGIPCDGLWVSGLTADRFPTAVSPTPFLPLGLQRARGLPGATAAGTLGDARRTLAAWRTAAPELVLSAPQQDDDGPLLRSVLIPAAPPPQLPQPAPRRAEVLRAAARLEPFDGGALPSLAAGAPLAGGARVLELQALCPFRAGAELRLGAAALESPASGLPRRVRGELAHAALAEFWRGVGSQQALLVLSAELRAQAVTAAVGHAFRSHRRPLPRSRLLELERQWLGRVLDQLLEVEARREPFEVVEREAEHLASPAGHALRVRVDRVDRLASGATALIDYKTGRHTPRRWAGPRPDAVQLAIYALARPEPPEAVAIARLALGNAGFVGVAARDGLLPGVAGVGGAGRAELEGYTWRGLLGEWRRTTDELARAHAAGEAAVDPAPAACERCALAALCRIDTVDTGVDLPREAADD